MGLGGVLPQTRAHADECLGETPFNIAGAGVRQLMLGNRHCFCYANALMLSLIHLDCCFEGPSIFSGSFARLVRAMFQAQAEGQIFHLWD